MISKKVILALAIGAVMHGGCNPREADASQSGFDEGMEEASATDRAETTVAITDTAALILPADTAGINKR